MQPLPTPTQSQPTTRAHRVTAVEAGLAERLERGEVVVFAPGVLPLPSEEDLVFLRVEGHIGLEALGR